MEIWQMTLNDFVGNWRVDDNDLSDVDRLSAKIIEEASQNWKKKTIKPIQNFEDYYFADIKDQPEDVLIVFWNDRYAEWDIIGGYIENTLWVDPYQRRKGFGTELVLEKARRTHNKLVPDSYTSLGRKTHEKAYWIALKREKEKAKG